MQTLRLRLKIGPHEFEAEGDRDAVLKQKEWWFEKTQVTPTVINPSKTVGSSPTHRKQSFAETPTPPSDLARVLAVQKGKVVLQAQLPGDGKECDIILMLLLGYKEILNVEPVSAVALGKSLRLSGVGISRADKYIAELNEKKLVLTSGFRVGSKHTLTIPGIAKAKECVKEIMALIG